MHKLCSIIARNDRVSIIKLHPKLQLELRNDSKELVNNRNPVITSDS